MYLSKRIGALMPGPARLDITGQRFGSLVAIKPHGHLYGVTAWLCKCDCGEEIVTTTQKLRTGRKTSCGCVSGRRNVRWRPETQRSKGGPSGKRNPKNNRLYRIYGHMLCRCCENKGADERHRRDWRDRGITVCEEWRRCFDSFESWALENGYREDLTIDRIDNDGPYSPENCRWATIAEQNANKRPSRRMKVE